MKMKAEGRRQLPAPSPVLYGVLQVCFQGFENSGVGAMSQSTPSGTRYSVPGDKVQPPSGLAVGPAPPAHADLLRQGTQPGAPTGPLGLQTTGILAVGERDVHL